MQTLQRARPARSGPRYTGLAPRRAGLCHVPGTGIGLHCLSRSPRPGRGRPYRPIRTRRTTLFREIDSGAIDLGELFKNSPNAYVVFDEALTIVGCNDAYLSAVGRQSDEDIVGRNVFDAFPSPVESPSYQLLRRSLDRVIATRKRDHIAVIPYDTSLPGEPPNMRYWSATHTPILDEEGTLRYILQHTVDVTELQRLRERSASDQIAEAGVLQRARAVQAANLAISAERELLKDMFEQAPGFIGILAGPAHTFLLANRSYIRLVGGRDLVGKTVADALPEVIGQGFVDVLDGVYRTGQPHVGESAAVWLQQEADAPPAQRFVDFVYQPIFSDDDQVSGIFVQGHDVTEKVEAERFRAIQNRELGHRLKNQLAMVQAIVSQTLRTATDMGSARESISARLRALAGAHDKLIAGQTGRTTVSEIVRSAVDLYGKEGAVRFRVDGPELAIAAQPALSLSLILHELSTNAVKYGALSNDEGRVTIDWGSRAGEAAPEFHLSWCEEGGPAVIEPKNKGTGSRLIEAGLSGVPSCVVTVRFEPAGLCCDIVADLEGMQAER